MPQPVPLHRRRPSHLAAPPPLPRENDEQRRDRQLELTRELTELNMIAARDAGHRIATRDPDADPAQTPAGADPTLALARATRAVTSVINLENRIASGEKASPFAIEDPRAIGLRKLLHPLVAHEPDPVRRRAIRARFDDRIDDALGADIDEDLPLAQIASVIASEHGFTLDLAKVDDEYLYPPSSPPPDWRAAARAQDGQPPLRT